MSKTDELIESLARGLRPVPPRALSHRFAAATLVSVGISLLLMLTVAGLRVDLPHAVETPVFWVKSAYNFLIAALSLAAIHRLAHPDGSAGPVFHELAGIFAMMLVVALFQLALSPADSYKRLVFGHSALHCPFLIFAFALPVLGGMFWWMRRAAPADPGVAGFISGLASGAAGAWVYSWFCTENGMPFVLIWYSLGILLTGLLGRLLGTRLLRW